MAKFRFALFRAKRRDGKLYPKWRIRYFRDAKAIGSEVGYTDKGRTQDKAKDHLRELEHKAHLQAVGAVQIKAKPLKELIALWLGELAAGGGKQNHPASPQHVRQCQLKIAFWVKTLAMTSPQDVNRAEAIAASRQIPVSKGTQDLYVQTLKTFLSWCVKNEFLMRNPLAGYKKQVAAPTFKRRALTVEEALRLLAVTPDRRALTYKAALLTGMRRQELASLTVSSVNWHEGTLHLKAAHAKNRREATFYLPALFLDELYAYAGGLGMSDPLLPGISPSHAAETLGRDLRKAGIPYETPEGRIDFHSLRVTFLTWVNELGEDVKTVQELGRHADPRMTFGIYTKAREARLREVVTRAGSRLLESNPAIPRHTGYHAGITQALPGKNLLVGQGLRGLRDDADMLQAPLESNPAIARTSADIQDAKAEVRHFFETATKTDTAGHSETQELSRRRHALLSQVTEALSRLPSEDLQAILSAIHALGQGRATA